MGDPNTGEIYDESARRAADVGLGEDEATALRVMELESRRKETLRNCTNRQDVVKPDLRTLEGALCYLDYHKATPDTIWRHRALDGAFQNLAVAVWNALPDGPGKTVAIRAIARARMECNSCIANGGQ